MLFQLGAVQLQIVPFNTHETSFESGADFAEKAVMGRRPTLEFMGEAADTRTINCRLFPERFGGLSDLAAVHKQRLAGKPLPFMRGDGSALGWYVIEGVSEKSTFLDATGVGRVVEVDIKIKRADPPGAGAIFSILSGLLS